MKFLRQRWKRVQQRAVMRGERRSRAVTGMAQGLFVSIIVLLLLRGTMFMQGWSNGTLDRWFTARSLLPHEDTTSPNVAILAIDRATRLAWKGRNFDAPDVGRALLLLKQNGVLAVAVDLPDLNRGFASARENAQWQRDLDAAGIAHLPLRFDAISSKKFPQSASANTQISAPPNAKTSTSSTRNVVNSAKNTARVQFGHTFLLIDSDAHVRRLPLVLQRGAQIYPSLALSAVTQALGIDGTKFALSDAFGKSTDWTNARHLELGERNVALGGGGSILLNFWASDPTAKSAKKSNSRDASDASAKAISSLHLPGATPSSSTQTQTAPAFSTISLIGALKNPALLQSWAGRCVVIGVTDSQSAPQWTLASGARVPEAIVHTIAIDNLLAGNALEPVLPLHLWLMTIALCVVVGGLVAARSPLWSGLVTVLALLAVVLMSLGLFLQSIWFDSSLPCLAAALTFLQGVVARARLQERETTRVSSTVDALERAGEIIATRGTSQELLQRVLQWTLAAMDAEAAFAMTKNPDSTDEKAQFRVLAVAQNKPRALDDLPPEAREEIAARVTQQSQPLLIPDVHRDLRLHYGRTYYTNFRALSAPGALHITSVLAAPLREGDPAAHDETDGVQTIGAIFVLNRRDGTPFHARDLELLTAVTNQASVALDNARLYDILNERVARSESDLKKTNRRLEAEKNTLQTVLESMTDGVVVTDSYGLVQILNPAAQALLPELDANSIGLPLAQCLPDIATSSAARMLESQQNLAAANLGNFISANASATISAPVFPNSPTTSSTRNHTNSPSQTTEIAARENESSSQNSSHKSAGLTNRNANKIENSPRTLAKNSAIELPHFEYSKSEIASPKSDVSANSESKSTPNQNESVKNADENARIVALPFLSTMQLQRGDIDEPRVIEVRSAPLLSNESSGAGIVWVFSDITEQKGIEQAKSDFVSFVAHEMRSPLTSISGFSSMLQRLENDGENGESSTRNAISAAENNVRERAKNAATRQRFLSVIHNESERLTRLINNLLDVARLEAGRAFELHLEALDFAAVANEAIESQRIYSRRHTLKNSVAPDLPRLFADRDKVLQILINLLSNAMKYSPGGIVEIAAHVDENFLVVSVRDEGPGIAPEHHARLFERFGRIGARALAAKNPGAGERAKPTGTGLGLFLTRHLVESHGGRLWLDAENSHGARFFFALPLKTETTKL